MYPRAANLRRNLKVGEFADLVITPTGDGAAVQRSLKLMYLNAGVTINGVAFTPDELVAMSEMPERPEPTEEERAREYESFTNGEVAQENGSDRTVELEDWREGLYPSWVRPGYVDWKREGE